MAGRADGADRRKASAVAAGCACVLGDELADDLWAEVSRRAILAGVAYGLLILARQALHQVLTVHIRAVLRTVSNLVADRHLQAGSLALQ